MHLNHPQTILTPGPWKNCLPQNLSLVPKTLGITDLLNRKNKHYIADLPTAREVWLKLCSELSTGPRLEPGISKSGALPATPRSLLSPPHVT